MKTLTLTLLALLLTFAVSAKPKDESAFIQFQSTDTLYIQIIDSVRMGNVGRNDRFRRIRSTLEEVFEESKFPMDYKISRFSNVRPPADQPFLMMTIMKWGDYGLSQIEVQFSASLRRSYDRNKLGMFYHRGGSSFMADERVYKEVLQKALEELVFDLNERFAQKTAEETADDGAEQEAGADDVDDAADAEAEPGA